MATTSSSAPLAVISPYPTVVIVVTDQYKAAKYLSCKVYYITATLLGRPVVRLE